MYQIHRLRALWYEDAGQDLIEYSLLLSLIALAAVLSIGAAGEQVLAIWNIVIGYLDV